VAGAQNALPPQGLRTRVSTAGAEQTLPYGGATASGNGDNLDDEVYDTDGSRNWAAGMAAFTADKPKGGDCKYCM
jgi:hypothetical protein